jgi:hypothetical protein
MLIDACDPPQPGSGTTQRSEQVPQLVGSQRRRDHSRDAAKRVPTERTAHRLEAPPFESEKQQPYESSEGNAEEAYPPVMPAELRAHDQPYDTTCQPQAQP